MNIKPNIVFFFADDQRFDTIHALGNEKIITPNIDKLVNTGVTFTHAHIPGGTVGAVCMPSRAMIHSGKSLFNLKDSGSSIPADHSLLGETLKNNGYRTFGTGKWHNGPEAYARSFTDGDEIFFGGMNDHWNVPAYHYDPSGKYDTKLPYVNDWLYKNNIAYINADHVKNGKHSSELFADASIDFIENYNADNPFFMYVSFMAPHDPRTMPEKFLKMYDAINIELPPNFMVEHPFDTGALKIRDEMLAEFPRNPEKIKKHITEYYAMITHLDHEIGRIIKSLEDAGKFENTIFIFAGDNGLAVGQHGLMGKQSCYEHSMRIPLVFAGPGIAHGVQNDSLVYLLDIFPTLCDLIDIETPDNIDGISLNETLSNSQRKVRDCVYLTYADVQRAISDKKFKLIEYVINGKHSMTQLFDLKNNPWELHNLAKSDNYREKIIEMRTKLFLLRDALGDESTIFGQTFWNAYKTSVQSATG
ncbi:MAG: sulfatase-like hydrolase/transferase [Victivallaceae bacterium]